MQLKVIIPGRLLDDIFDCGIEPEWKQKEYVTYVAEVDDENLVTAYLVDENKAVECTYEPQELIRLMECIKNGQCEFVEYL